MHDRVWALCAVLLWAQYTQTGDQHLDYIMTLPEDPLYITWNRVDKISREILKGFQLQMEHYHLTIQGDLHHLNSKLSLLEDKLTSRVTKVQAQIKEETLSKLTFMEARIKDQTMGLTRTITSNTDVFLSIKTYVTKISKKLSGLLDVKEDTRNCTELLSRVSQLTNTPETVNGSGLKAYNTVLIEETVQELRSAVAQLRESPAFLPRDCSDLHWHQHQAPSGVFQTYPTMDPKVAVEVWCDMGQDGAMDDGGWTVILRRQNTSWGLTDFNRTWSEYRAGFGVPGEGEWWYGLASLHALTYHQPYDVHFLMHDMELGYFEAHYNTFRVNDEAHSFRLVAEGFSGNVTTDAFRLEHQGRRPFSTWDRDQDGWQAGNCALEYAGGWWYNVCVYLTLTAPYPAILDRSAKTIRWLMMENLQILVLDDVTVKIRPADYAHRFDSRLQKHQ